MRFLLDVEQRAFAGSLDAMLAAADTPSVVRDWSRGDHTSGRALWSRIAEAGVFSLAVAEKYGGMGLRPVELTVAFIELGRHAVPGPLVETVAAAVLLDGLDDACPAERLLPTLASGASVATFTTGRYALDADMADVLLAVTDPCTAAPRPEVPGPPPAATLYVTPPPDHPEGPPTPADRPSRLPHTTAAPPTRARHPAAPVPHPATSAPQPPTPAPHPPAPNSPPPGPNSHPPAPVPHPPASTPQPSPSAPQPPTPATHPPASAPPAPTSAPTSPSPTNPPHPSLDPARRLFPLPPGGDPLPTNPQVSEATARALLLARLATAAQALGVGVALLDKTVGYVKQRTQFGVPIGSFQAVKHRLADAKIALEFARPLLFGAALTLSPGDVAAAKVAACEAAYRTARTALQLHGAIGYTAEYDLSLWLTKARALRTAWGGPRTCRALVLSGGGRRW
ncbi:acyl-CoA dehydrogenase family protein [Streptomyces sp. NBC_00588]|nr:acyl-CoA dehydrogenase family protein [Streptomyces sp. NBC_00588]WUB39061.1 acyl-CoA dehydrogenase family protein [Streptomyces sp. NBC_00588]